MVTNNQIKINNQIVFENGKLNGGLLSFILYDTYGFPFDLTQQILREHNIEINEDDFEKYLQEQRNRSKADREKNDGNVAKSDEVWKELADNLAKSGFETEKLYYQNLTSCDSKIVAIVKNNEIVNCLNEGEEGFVVLDKTVFYPCGGGEVGDTGVISKSIVKDTKKFKGNLIGHLVSARETLNVGDIVNCYSFRKNVCKNHTSTHLLQSALRIVLGKEIQQKGSQVDENGLRFDFSATKPMTDEEIQKVEELVNKWIEEFLPVKIEEMKKEDAEKLEALHFFEDKYGDIVRVVQVLDLNNQPISIEFCGGIHCKNTGEIEKFKITKETSIGSGVRRIFAITGIEQCHNFEVLQEAKISFNSLKEEIAKYKSASEIQKRCETMFKIRDNAVEKDGVIYLNGENINQETAKIVAKLVMSKNNKPVFIEIKTINNNEISEVFYYNCCQKEHNYNCKEVMQKIIEEKKGKGGGCQTFAQCVCLI